MINVINPSIVHSFLLPTCPRQGIGETVFHLLLAWLLSREGPVFSMELVHRSRVVYRAMGHTEELSSREFQKHVNKSLYFVLSRSINGKG